MTLPPNLIEIGGHAFFRRTSLSEVTLPPNLTEIGGHAFRGRTSLSEITLPPTLTVIGRGAFFRCTSLSETTLPPNLTEIGGHAFRGSWFAAAQPCRDRMCIVIGSAAFPSAVGIGSHGPSKLSLKWTLSR